MRVGLRLRRLRHAARRVITAQPATLVGGPDRRRASRAIYDASHLRVALPNLLPANLQEFIPPQLSLAVRLHPGRGLHCGFRQRGDRRRAARSRLRGLCTDCRALCRAHRLHDAVARPVRFSWRIPALLTPPPHRVGMDQHRPRPVILLHRLLARRRLSLLPLHHLRHVHDLSSARLRRLHRRRHRALPRRGQPVPPPPEPAL
mmetsp:Transcript_21559/g.71296  ORF Transcript_21559/g.71296 Transcript_21559/m.71296 type:complete len:203 (+) Transcript_21559:710-1318(+)